MRLPQKVQNAQQPREEQTDVARDSTLGVILPRWTVVTYQVAQMDWPRAPCCWGVQPAVGASPWDWEETGKKLERDVASWCSLWALTHKNKHKMNKHKIVHVDAFQMSDCHLPWPGVLVWYLSKVLRGRFALDCVTCPCRENLLSFFFLSFMISTRSCGGHKILSATSWLKQLVVLFVKVQFSFWGKSIQLIT